MIISPPAEQEPPDEPTIKAVLVRIAEALEAIKKELHDLNRTLKKQ